MSEMPSDAWFYTREGEKIGPVTFSDLRIKATEGLLNPRLDMVWKQGMDGWKASGEIEGLFERRPPPEPLQEPSEPYQTPPQQSAAEVMNQQTDWPGARRRSYLLMTFIFPWVWYVGVGMGEPFLWKKFGPQIMEYSENATFFILVVVVIYFGVRRLINLGMSAWWWLGNLVPFLNLWLGYRCFACPSGYAYHKKLDGVGIFLAIVYWLVMASFVLVTAITAAVFLGKLGSPELRQKVQDAYQQGVEQAERRIEKQHEQYDQRP